MEKNTGYASTGINGNEACTGIPITTDSNDINLQDIKHATASSETSKLVSLTSNGLCPSTTVESPITIDMPGLLDNSIQSIYDEYENTRFENTSSSSDNEDEFSLRSSIANWAVSYNISHSALSALLSLLRLAGINVPKDSRTVLSTPKLPVVQTVAGGSYYYRGVGRALQAQAHDLTCETEFLSLNINVDGVPLFRSSNMSLWPILGMIKEIPQAQPFVIALYCGTQKPSSATDYLRDFVDEIKDLSKSGVQVGGKTYKLRLHAIICDAPARSFLKSIKGHSGYNSCERCIQEGEWDGRVIFPDINSPLRDDQSFHEISDESHHTGVSLLRELDFGLVSGVVLDYMHLVCLGAVRKILLYWILGPLTVRLPHATISTVSSALSSVREFIPREFQRKPRSLSEVKLWKATEFRQFLLYSGPVVLHGKLKSAFYHNFLLLSVCIRILLSPEMCKLSPDYVTGLLKVFVQNFSLLYGKKAMVYNMHSLIHLVDDVKLFGPLDNVSCFPFESMLGQLKKMVRRPESPVSQLVRRIEEKEQAVIENASCNSISKMYCHEHSDGPLVPGLTGAYRQYRQYLGENLFLSTTFGNNCIMIGEQIGLVRNVLAGARESLIVFDPFRKRENFFVYPFESSVLDIYVVSRVSGRFSLKSVSSVKKKYVLFPWNREQFVAIPLLHH